MGTDLEREITCEALLADFFVIAVGVLVALAVDAWRMKYAALAVLVAAATVTACEPDAAESVGPTVLDSAGVRFVEHPNTVGAPFELGPAALVEVGLGETTDLTLFEVAGGVLTSTDEFIIADAGNYRLVRWSVSGELLGVVGGQGDGPGEFQSIAWMQETDAEVALYDARSRRISWFDPSRGFLRSVQFDVERPDPPSDDAITTSGTALGVVGATGIVGYAIDVPPSVVPVLMLDLGRWVDQ